MATIPQKELRNQVSEVLRRVERGETLVVTVAGRPVAELSPTHSRQWVGGTALAGIFHTDAPKTLAEDLEAFPAELSDPFEG